MTTTAVDASAIRPLIRDEAVELGQEAYRRLIDELRPLQPDDWARPTDCTLWTVRDLAGHVGGMMRSMSTLRGMIAEQVRAARRARREGTTPVDAMTAIQVEALAPLAPDEVVACMADLVDEAVAGRRRPPAAFARTVRFPQEVNGRTERWTLDYLLGTILTRDTWLHRVADLARAVDRAPRLDAAHDGRIVADVVGEWARRHGQPFDLTLTGPAGGRFRVGDGGPSLEVDAVELCRMLSGRAQPTHPLLETEVPF